MFAEDELNCCTKGSHTHTHATRSACCAKLRLLTPLHVAAVVGCCPLDSFKAGDTRGPLAQGPGAVQSWAAAAVAAMMTLASSSECQALPC